MTNPDLVLADTQPFAVADVKYKLAGSEWKRPDLYQAVAFAAGFSVLNAAIIEFLNPMQVSLPPVRVGPILVSHIGWDADPSIDAATAAGLLSERFSRWLAASRGPKCGTTRDGRDLRRTTTAQPATAQLGH